jgi:hypothetical protein
MARRKEKDLAHDNSKVAKDKEERKKDKEKSKPPSSSPGFFSRLLRRSSSTRSSTENSSSVADTQWNSFPPNHEPNRLKRRPSASGASLDQPRGRGRASQESRRGTENTSWEGRGHSRPGLFRRAHTHAGPAGSELSFRCRGSSPGATDKPLPSMSGDGPKTADAQASFNVRMRGRRRATSFDTSRDTLNRPRRDDIDNALHDWDNARAHVWDQNWDRTPSSRPVRPTPARGTSAPTTAPVHTLRRVGTGMQGKSTDLRSESRNRSNQGNREGGQSRSKSRESRSISRGQDKHNPSQSHPEWPSVGRRRDRSEDSLYTIRVHARGSTINDHTQAPTSHEQTSAPRGYPSEVNAGYTGYDPHPNDRFYREALVNRSKTSHSVDQVSLQDHLEARMHSFLRLDTESPVRGWKAYNSSQNEHLPTAASRDRTPTRSRPSRQSSLRTGSAHHDSHENRSRSRGAQKSRAGDEEDRDTAPGDYFQSWRINGPSFTDSLKDSSLPGSWIMR